ncbi:50S ribosomal protein L32e [Candidatus Pacearchaeota archaeon]|nr:50S ribosomal protein L32e [Candidatus Pacearchaeota archaeon]|tara:strand:- start:898 stop:1263 length:366 start_codon:yes stop_codon:yes gene_type:complete
MAKKFVRQDSMRHLKLGKKRTKLQKWRKPKGRHSKMRLKRKSYPATVSMGYKKPQKESGKIKGKLPITVSTFSDLNKVQKENIIVLSRRLGAKKKIELIKKALDAGFPIFNVTKSLKEKTK